MVTRIDIMVAWIIFLLALWVLWHYLGRKILSRQQTRRSLRQIHHLLNTLYTDQTTATALQQAKHDREHSHADTTDFTYGEISPAAFLEMLRIVQPKQGEVFYDIGSGMGKVVLMAAASGWFQRVCGIEYLPALHSAAVTAWQRAWGINSTKSVDYSRITSSSQQLHYRSRRQATLVEWQQADFLDCDFSDADVILINATCLEDQTWQQLMANLHHLKRGARIIITSKQLPDNQDAFSIIDGCALLMSWGYCSVHCYSKN